MPAQRLPWFRFWVGATSNGKVRTLDDGTFRTWVELLDAAAQQPQRGRFVSRAEAIAITRRPAKHVAALITARLIDETPDGLLMHDWDDWQRWRKEDANDPGSPPDEPPNDHRNGHTNDSRTTTERHTNVATSLREKKDVDVDVDVEKEGEVTTVSLRSTGSGKKPRAALGNPRVAAYIDAYRAFCGEHEPPMCPRDAAAIKRSTAPPELIAETYRVIKLGQWGTEFQKNNLCVHSVVGWVNAYALWREERGYEPFERRHDPSLVLVSA